MKYQYRITKYNPVSRDESGAYRLAEWTAFSDIGKEFSGVRLDEAEYLRVESAYLAAVQSFLEEAKLPSLVVKGLEWDRSNPVPAFVAEGAALTILQCVAFSRLALREALWGRLVIPGKAYLHFGHDYYLYIGVPVACRCSIAAAERNGLFVEPFRSPHLRASSCNSR